MLQHHDTVGAAAFALTDAARLLRSEIDKSVVESGIELTPGAIRTLLLIQQYQGVRQSVLAERMGVEPMTVTAYLDRLEARGLIERKVDPADRRAKVVTVTDKVEHVFNEIRPILTRAYERAMSGIEPMARTVVESSLERMRVNLSEV
ncbi:MarR family winged helix-turn-helix transcriptional regulator [Consotaella aegiceratis]|uniref:MarR family winged helix-turn-helix transcriptional regulator n=1 Tax=Consotaella aegiceratis TaxID=3097961 RepID=UPI002F40CC51